MRRVRKAHGDKVILDDVSLNFLPGAKIGVVGPNGAGKSTVLKIMAGLEHANNGDAQLAPPDRGLPLEVGHGGVTVDLGLAHAEPTEVGTVEDEDVSHGPRVRRRRPGLRHASPGYWSHATDPHAGASQ